jgi:hypothetical protein
MTNSSSDKKSKLSMLSIFKSVLAAGFGVQKDANREKDFEQGKAIHFVIAGVVATLLFLLMLWGVVQMILINT